MHSRPQAEEDRYRDEEVRLPTDEGDKLVLLRGIVEEGASRGWRLVIAVKQPEGEALLVTWDTGGAFPA